MSSMLKADRVEVEDDVRAFTASAFARGWSDGLPVLQPTEPLVEEYVAASGLSSDFQLGVLYPRGVHCTVELLAINAVMAGAPANAMPLLAACVSAIADDRFDLSGINATTVSVAPAFIVNGPVRNEVNISYKHGAFGGAAGPTPAVGRTLRLVLRNVAGEVVGQTSEAVFGQPGRVVGIVAAEWEERSHWPPLAERRGVSGSAVTAFGVLGAANILDGLGTDGREIVEVIGKSLAYLGNNNYDKGSTFAHQLVAVNPIWADKIYASYPNMEDIQQLLYDYTALPVDRFPATLIAVVESQTDKIRDGKVHLMDTPDDVSLIVNGGEGNLHGMMFPGMSNSVPVTRSLDVNAWPEGTVVT